jgi:hypothetical protein
MNIAAMKVFDAQKILIAMKDYAVEKHASLNQLLTMTDLESIRIKDKMGGHYYQHNITERTRVEL